jgi:hypothetical protein
MCHHYRGARQPPAHLADEFSLRTNLYQLMLPEEGFYPLAQTPIVRIDERGEREFMDDSVRDQKVADLQREIARCP